MSLPYGEHFIPVKKITPYCISIKDKERNAESLREKLLLRKTMYNLHLHIVCVNIKLKGLKPFIFNLIEDFLKQHCNVNISQILNSLSIFVKHNVPGYQDEYGFSMGVDNKIYWSRGCPAPMRKFKKTRSNSSI